MSCKTEAEVEAQVLKGHQFCSKRWPGWDQHVPVDDVHIGDHRHCMLAWAGKSVGLATYSDVRDLLQTENSALHTDLWFYEHGFYWAADIEPVSAEVRHGYELRTHLARELIALKQTERYGLGTPTDAKQRELIPA
jgi:hypothetical protein